MSEPTGPDLAPDEKVCPYCAETIKAAAVKCRFCQSDLPVDPEPTSPPDPDPEPDADPDPEPGPEPEPDLTLPGSRSLGAVSSRTRLVAALLVVCLLLGGLLWFEVHRSLNPDLDKAPNGQVTQSSFRNAAMSAGSDAAAQILSYSYKTFDADREKGEALVTGKAAEAYAQAMDEVADKVATNKLTLKATVLSVGTVSVKEHQAKLLVFVDTSTTREGSQRQQVQQSRLLMTLTRKDGDWTVTQMDPV